MKSAGWVVILSIKNRCFVRLFVLSFVRSLARFFAVTRFGVFFLLFFSWYLICSNLVFV